jgi:ABC-2 type transport system ATP-binding protein
MGVNHVSLDVYPGITGFLGPNGAGKSTVLKLIAGLVHPSSGTVKVFEENPRLDPHVLARIGYCPEHDAFYPDMTGKQFVAHFLRVRGEEREMAFKKAELILRRLDLEDKMDRRIGGYSRGMKQKVKVAAAVVHNPDLLILDEPLQGADPESRHLLIRNLRAWAKAGMTIVVSSHVLKEIERMTRRLVLINEGRVYAVGDMDQIRSMMTQRPITVRIALKRPDELRKLAAILMSEPSVGSVRVQMSDLIVHTVDAQAFYAAAPRILTDNGFAINEFVPVDDDLESLYYFLMSQRRW